MAMNDMKYADNTIYMILSHQPARTEYHVGLYISVNGESGLVFHATGSAGDFEYEGHLSESIQHSKEIRLALIIGHIREEEQLDLLDQHVMPNVPIHNEDLKFNCWSWVRLALGAMRDADVVSFSCTPEDIEAEARMLIKGVESRGQVGSDRIKVSRLCS